MTQPSPTISITHTGGYQFVVDFGGLIPELAVDEPVPIGAGEGPSPEQLLMAGVTNCLCASLVFALTKYRASGGAMKATATCNIGRNDKGRLRIDDMDVVITVHGLTDNERGTERALMEFENFCTVSESVKRGIPVGVTVCDEQGAVLRRRKSGEP